VKPSLGPSENGVALDSQTQFDVLWAYDGNDDDGVNQFAFLVR